MSLNTVMRDGQTCLHIHMCRIHIVIEKAFFQAYLTCMNQESYEATVYCTHKYMSLCGMETLNRVGFSCF